jgi:hypothetical protein
MQASIDNQHMRATRQPGSLADIDRSAQSLARRAHSVSSIFKTFVNCHAVENREDSAQ